MNVICEECGKIYHVDRHKLVGMLDGNPEGIFSCKVCGHSMVISSLLSKAEDEPVKSDITRPDPSVTQMDISSIPSAMGSPKPELDTKPSSPITVPDALEDERKGRSSFSLRTKMFFFFLFIPILLMASSSYLNHWNVTQMVNDITDKNTEVAIQMGQDDALKIARFTASQCRSYLINHPFLKNDDFNFDLGFKRVAIQETSKTGYTVFVEIKKTGEMITWAHPNPKLVGTEGSALLKKLLGKSSKDFFSVINKAKSGKEAEGYYSFRAKEGDPIKEKFMVVTPVKGTPYYIVSTTFKDEFLEKINIIKRESVLSMNRINNFNLAMVGGLIIIIGLIISIYGHRITAKIKSLTDASDRISVGELDVEIDVFSKDEIGDLAESISRMQDSLRLSIERLRRRRK